MGTHGNGTAKTLDPMRVWDQVATTDPGYTKHVQQGARSYHAINPQYQLQEATQLWGPCGARWGVDWEREPADHDLFLVRVHLWYPDADAPEGVGHVYAYGAAPLVIHTKQGERVDADAPKKAVTDGRSKALSTLGFSADVFLGAFDDNRHAHPADARPRRRREATPPRAADPEPDPEPDPPGLRELQAAFLDAKRVLGKAHAAKVVRHFLGQTPPRAATEAQRGAATTALRDDLAAAADAREPGAEG